MKVLVIEDEVDLNRSIVKLLKTQQYSVDAAYDGQEALDYIRVSQYDVIISEGNRTGCWCRRLLGQTL